MRIFYECALYLIALGYLPKAIYMRIRFGKYKNWLYRLGFKCPRLMIQNKPIVWIHSCSVGETKAASTLVQYLSNYDLIISTTTETGLETAKKDIPSALHHITLPFDFRWALRRLFKQVQPKLLILVETDFWLNFILEANCPVALVSGVLSERSMKRYRHYISFFDPINLFCVQNQAYQNRFLKLGISSHITGNLKYDLPCTQSTHEDFTLTIASTHTGEETFILDALEPLTKKYPQLTLFIVPRHPERFDQVRKCLESRKATPVTQMGVLRTYYSKSSLAIVGGSFLGNIGGHNILEPVQHGVPVLFGPQMHKQSDMVELVTKAGAGHQVEGHELASIVEKHLSDSAYHTKKLEAAKALSASLRGVSKKTFDVLQKEFNL